MAIHVPDLEHAAGREASGEAAMAGAAGGEVPFGVLAGVLEQRVSSGSTWQQGPQHTAIWQHQLLQQLEVMLPRFVTA